MLPSKTVAILGATSHIAKNIIFEFAANTQYHLMLYARSLESVTSFLDDINQSNNSNISVHSLTDFGEHRCDVIINCIGIGNPAKLKEDNYQIFYITEHYDNLILDYLRNKSRDSLYINLSSGAIYGTEFSQPVDEESSLNLPINKLNEQNYYGIAKLNSEAKHRSLDKFNIVDLRVFSFFSRFIDLNSKFLITEIINSISNNTIFLTGNSDILRDYIHPKDFCNLVQLCINKHYINNVYDVYSLSPVSKFELINMFSDNFSLKFSINDSLSVNNSTGQKSIYCSINKKAEELNYIPSSTSLDSIREEARKILYNKR